MLGKNFIMKPVPLTFYVSILFFLSRVQKLFLINKILFQFKSPKSQKSYISQSYGIRKQE